MPYPIYQVDAFSDALFQGNPAAVCPLKEWLPNETMQNIAAENNLAETAFFVPSSNGFDLRWFTPAVEVDLCGHATLASAHVLFQYLDFKEETISFYTRSGLLQVSRKEDWYLMDFPADELQKVAIVPEVIKQSLGFEPKELYRGRDDFMAIVEDQKTIEALNPDFRALLQLEARGLIVTSPGEEVDFVSRCFFTPVGIDEDPVTGSAHTTLTPFWAKRLGKNQLTARQLSKRGGFLKCDLNTGRVVLHGQAKTYLKGEIYLG